MTWLLPAFLAATQIALWPGRPLAHGGPVDPVTAAAVVAITIALAAALSWRTRAPVAVTVATAAAISLSTWVLPEQVFLTPGDGVAVNALTDLVALFSVAARRSRRTTVLVIAGLLLWQAALLAVRPADYLLDLLLSAVLYVLAAAAGRVRGRWRGDRAAAARRLAEAEQTRHEAAGAERRRLARELHDVTAHHLTSIVVNASAAQYLAEQRPDLHAEALDFAARTGRQTLTDLRRLVAVLPSADEAPPSLTDLVDDFRRLGQVVLIEVSGDPPPPVAEALHAVAREALTNTLRYAPGGQVTLLARYGPDGALLIVEDDGGTATTTAAADLGGGRGLAGLRERVAALGGTVEAGPRGSARPQPDGGPAGRGPAGRGP
ncbi:histidine kinase, partial [Actinoplanes sp. NPDC026619]|uniref:sensor histidine kinase n=1 Tax=Actinoplanes sp. NPDC026619 TaxID=3155798 RepID=UPI00340042B0